MPGFPRARDPATRARLSNRAQDWGQPQAYHCVGCLNESGKESSCQFEKPENYPWASWYRTASNSFSLLERIFISQTRQLSKSNPVSQVKSGTSNAENAKPAFFFFFFCMTILKHTIDCKLMISSTQPSQTFSRLWVPLGSQVHSWVSGRFLRSLWPLLTLCVCCLFKKKKKKASSPRVFWLHCCCCC